jgi:hypothetical protein
MSIDLFHHAGLAIASYAQDWVRTDLGITYISRVGRHHRQVVLCDDLLHLLHAAEVAQHVADRHDVAVLEQRLRDLLGRLDGARTDGLRSAQPTVHPPFQ